MAADPPYFDTSYLVRLYLEDRGFEAVRKRAAAASSVAAAWHARAEVMTAMHRALRERRVKREAFHAALEQFLSDSGTGLFHWLPVGDTTLGLLERVLRNAPASAFVRAADGLHLACAAEHGFKRVFSNDRHFLAAAPLFGLQGEDLIRS
jgi:predicted nucleic acid-binding protein